MTDDRDEEKRRQDFERRRRRRRERLHRRFRQSRNYHEPPPDPEEFEFEPTWRLVLRTLWDNPLSLVLIAMLVALVLYVFFSPVAIAAF